MKALKGDNEQFCPQNRAEKLHKANRKHDQ